MKTKKSLLVAFFIIFLVLVYIYICAIDSIPNNTILFQDEELKVKTVMGMSLNYNNENTGYKAVQTSTATKLKEQGIGTKKLQVKLFDRFVVKEVGVSVIERTTVIPGGQVAGLKLYTNGVLVVGMSELVGIDNKKYKPYENTGIQEGDIIVEVNDKNIMGTDNLIDIINSSKGNEVKIKYLRKDENKECIMKPVNIGNSVYKLGLWVRDSAAGIGTMTFYDPKSGSFAALGHGIIDIDTGDLIDISEGEFITTNVLAIVKGKEGEPGKIQGSIEDQEKIGNIYKNTTRGVYGYVTDISSARIDLAKQIPVATRNEIELGEASILCSLDGELAKGYKIQIEKIFLNNDYDNKSMLIRVTDDDLLKKTGGIIQGMSGSPIIQNGKFIGAVTNVLVNDPSKGYGIFGDIMIKEMND